MAVELYDLYKEIYLEYEVKLLTTSCFDKEIDWMHFIENDEFAYLLHGGELLFNSSLNFESEEVRRRYIDKFIDMKAGGLIVALDEGNEFSPELIEYCNQKKLPLMVTNWQTPFLEITRKFSAILLVNERNETNLIGALKNAIHSPLDADLYQSCFERNLLFRDMTYTISIWGNISDVSARKLIRTSLQHSFKKAIIYEENEKLVILTTGYQSHHLYEIYKILKEKYSDLCVSVGSSKQGHADIVLSYRHALTTYKLIGKAIKKSFLCYSELSVYQLLTDVKNPQTCNNFYQKVLGKLVDYDLENKTNYLEILEKFFEHECHLANTADAMFFHKNTLKYKLAKIREILGYDILSNENRMNIMLAFRIQKLEINISHS